MDVFGINTSLFGAQGGAPTYNFGQGVPFSNTGAQAGNSICNLLGGNSDTCGQFGANVGMQSGSILTNLSSPSAQSAYNGAVGQTSYTSSDGVNNLKCVTGIGSCDKNQYNSSGNRQGVPGSVQAANGFLDTAVGNATTTFKLLSNPTALAALVIGIVLVAGSVFMLKSPISISTSAIKGALA
jgi:hypothetical protein